MSIFGRNQLATVRKRSRWALSQATYLGVCLIVAALTYGWLGPGLTLRHETTEATATAAIHLRRAIDVDPERVRSQVTELAEPAIRDALRIETDTASTPGQCNIAIALRGSSSDVICRSVNALAQAYAEACRNEWRSQAQRACTTAREAASRAGQDLHEAQTQLESMIARQQHAPPSASPQVALVDNPDWVAIDHQLADLRQRRAQLLLERTALHPAVQDIETRIDQIQRQLAAVEPKIAANKPSPAPAAAPQMATTEASEFERLRQAVAQAGRAQQEAEETQRRAWQAQQQGPPRIDIDLAQPRTSPAGRPFNASALLAAVAAGLSTMTGLAMISTGAAIEPRLDSVAQLEEVLGLPVVGVVGSADPRRRPPLRNGVRRRLRLGLIVVGMLLIVACVLGVVMSRPS